MWSWLNSFSLETLSKYYTVILYVIVVLSLLTSCLMYLGIKVNQRIDYLNSIDKITMQNKLNNLSPRVLTSIDKIILSNKLIALKNEVIGVKYLNDPETSNLSTEIISIMQTSGIITNANVLIIAGPLPYGIIISSTISKTSQDVLLDAFKSVGLEPQIGTDLGQVIIIGLKPIANN